MSEDPDETPSRCFWRSTPRGRVLVQVVLKSQEFAEPSSGSGHTAHLPPEESSRRISMPAKRTRPSRSNDQQGEDNSLQAAKRTMSMGPYATPPTALPGNLLVQHTTSGEGYDRVPVVFSDPFRRRQVGAMNVYIAKFISCVKSVPLLVQVQPPLFTTNDHQPRAPWNHGFQAVQRSHLAVNPLNNTLDDSRSLMLWNHHPTTHGSFDCGVRSQSEHLNPIEHPQPGQGPLHYPHDT